MSEMLRKKMVVKSEKYGVMGEILDYGMVIKLFFSYQGKDVVIGLDRTWEDTEDAWKKRGTGINGFLYGTLECRRKESNVVLLECEFY